MNAPLANPASSKATIRLSVDGMHCGSCVARVESTLLAHPGVAHAVVNLGSGQASVGLTDNSIAPQALATRLSEAGYEAHVIDAAGPPRPNASHQDGSRMNLVIALVLTAPVFATEMGSHLSPAFADWLAGLISVPALRWLQLVLSAAVLFGCGREFFAIGVPALLRRSPEMNSLVALGASAAWFYSSAVTIMPHWLPAQGRHVYFEAAAVIVCLILLGRHLEALARRKTSAAIDALSDLQPTMARVMRDGAFIATPIDQVKVGDRVQVRPGDRIAVDGTIVSGAGNVDESMLTGESNPLSKSSGDSVCGGTINLSGSLVVRVDAVGADTTLAAIIDQVWEAQNTKLPIQALVDKIAMWFVPMVILIAIATFAAWAFLASDNGLRQGLIHAIAVLVIACPCAMGLATPLSIMVASGRAAREGLLFRDGQALQQLGRTRAVAFDKTGTLTVGKPHVTKIEPVDGLTGDQLLSLLVAVQQHSEHPLAQAVLAHGEAVGIRAKPASEFESFAGMGVRAQVEGQTVVAGNRQLMAQMSIDHEQLDQKMRLHAQNGLTSFAIAVDGRAVGIITVADTVRPEARDLVARLKARGLNIVLISGDRQETANAIARSLNIDHAFGEVAPAAKRGKVRELQNQYDEVTFVGDGINDAPALAQANVGIAIGSGTDVAIEAADIVLAGSNLTAIDQAISLSRATMRNIWQNLFWAFLYNLLLIPVAAGALSGIGLNLSPMLAAAAMSLSSLFVVFNALRLNRVDRQPEPPAPIDRPLAQAS